MINRKINYKIYSEKILSTLRNKCRKNNRYNEILENLPKFIFLCGKEYNNEEKTNRELVEELYKKHRKDVICVFSENLWENFHISLKDSSMELLSFEEFLAELSDGIIIFLESYGTVSEFGSFVMEDSLLEKMVVFNERSFKNERTFLNLGPLKKLEKYSEESVIHVDMNAIFSNEKTSAKLFKIANTKTVEINKEQEKIKLSSFIIEILELVWLFQPISKEDLIEIYLYIKEFEKYRFFSTKKLYNININQVITFLKDVKLIEEVEDKCKILDSRFQIKNFMLNLKDEEYYEIRSKILVKQYKNQKGTKL